MSNDPRADLTALVTALIEALVAHQAAQRAQPPVAEPPPVDEEPALLPVPAAAKRLGISRSAAYRWAQTGALPTRRFGSRVYVVMSELREMLDPPGKEAA